MKQPYEYYIDDLNKQNRNPTNKELLLLGRIRISDRWYKIKRLFKRG